MFSFGNTVSLILLLTVALVAYVTGRMSGQSKKVKKRHPDLPELQGNQLHGDTFSTELVDDGGLSQYLLSSLYEAVIQQRWSRIADINLMAGEISREFSFRFLPLTDLNSTHESVRNAVVVIRISTDTIQWQSFANTESGLRYEFILDGEVRITVRSPASQSHWASHICDQLTSQLKICS